MTVASRRRGQEFGSPRTLGHWGSALPSLTFAGGSTPFAIWGDRNTEREIADSELRPRVMGATAGVDGVFERGKPIQHGGNAIGITTGADRAIAAWTYKRRVIAGVHRNGSYCRRTISRRPVEPVYDFPGGDIAANERGDSVAVWSTAKEVMVAMGPFDGRSPRISRPALRLRDGSRPRVSLLLSEAAEVRLRIERRTGGRYRPVRSIVASLPAGANRIIPRTVSGGLRPGSYRARLVARDCGGRRSKRSCCRSPSCAPRRLKS